MNNKAEVIKKSLCHFSDSTVNQLMQSGFFDEAELVQIPKGKHVIKAGEKQRYTCLLVEGVIRGYLFDEKEKEITNCLIYRPGMAVMPGPNFDEPALQSLQALTKTTILRFPLLRFDSMLGYSPEILRAAVKIFISHFEDTWDLKMAKYRFDAEELYSWFVQRHGELLGRISNKYIASYLGMTPSTLSRIQKRFRKDVAETAVQAAEA